MTNAQWNKDSLFRLVQEKLGDYLFILVSNREPYVHNMVDGKIVPNRPVGGLVQALDPVMRASKGTWIAHGSGSADKEVVDSHNRLAVPEEAPEYTLRRVWLTDEEVAGHYLGFSNEALWPLCHVTFTPPTYHESEWETYKKVNHIFADAILEEVGDRKAVVLVQDYHFALLPGILKERNPGLTVGQFWHIPWPTYEIFRTCPWQKEVLEGMLGNSLMGFHIQSFCDNFLDSAERALGAEVDRANSTVTYKGKTTRVEPFPISVDFDGISTEAADDAVEREIEAINKELNLEGKYLGIGMDRIDYTKGIPERLQALDKFFADSPEYIGKVVFVQAGMPSRTQIEKYKNLMDRTDELAERLNARYGTADWKPVVMWTRQLSPVALNALRRRADFCIVSSLHDGMNLVAKEYVAARTDGDGVLILSEFTGAAVEMTDSLLINPFNIGEFALSIKQAVEMPEAERRRRMKGMREVVDGNNIYRWGGDHVSRLISLAGI